MSLVSVRVLALVSMLLSVSAAAQAQVGHAAQVPDAAAYALASAGFATVIVVQNRRRRFQRVRQGARIGYRAAKRGIDLLLSTSALLIAFPAFAFISLLVGLDSPGPILFKRRVIGKRGEEFDMFKFRTMVVGAEEMLQKNDDLKKQYYGNNCKLREDPRVTRLGRFLRRTSLDELPQLINVLLGEMAFVGPRPIAADEVEKYGPAFERFKTVKPGITGLWQTSGRCETSYPERVELDMHYIDKRSVLLDLWLIAWTLPAVLLRRGAC